jgi:hypothetical protein
MGKVYEDGGNTFTKFPSTPSTSPTTNYQVANKKYVDDSGGGGGGAPNIYSENGQNYRTVPTSYATYTGASLTGTFTNTTLHVLASVTAITTDSTSNSKCDVRLKIDGDSRALTSRSACNPGIDNFETFVFVQEVYNLSSLGSKTIEIEIVSRRGGGWEVGEWSIQVITGTKRSSS